MKKRILPLLALVFSFLFSAVNAQDSEPAAPLRAAGLANPREMVRAELLAKIDAAQAKWQEKYNTLKTPEQIEAYQFEERKFFQSQLGEMWERTPLNAQVTGTIVKPEYRAEKIVMETIPHFYATGTLFLPNEEKFKPPYPGVLVVCGHSFNGKASDLYQGLCILGAMNGLAMYIQDPIDQGERFQTLKTDGTPLYAGTTAHSLLGAGSILLGRNAATYEVWDMIRGLDFLQSRPEVIPDRLGVAGNSGGGTQSSYLMALDERVACAAPSCYLCSLYGAQTHSSVPQDAEQNIFGQLGFGMDHADYILMRAPKPTLLNTKTGDFFNIDDTWKAYRNAVRIYSRFGLSQMLSIIEIEGDHGYCPALLDASVSWFLRWLAGRDEQIHGTYPLPLLTEEEIRSTEKGVMALPEARTAFDINRDFNRELAERRHENSEFLTPQRLAEIVRSDAVIRPLSGIPLPEVADVPEFPDVKILKTEEGRIWIPIRRHTENGDRVRLLVTEKGISSSDTAVRIEKLSGAEVWSVEPRGWGETQIEGTSYYDKKLFGGDGTVWYLAYLLGETFVGSRAEDVLTAARWLKETTGKEIELAADTPSAGIVALHARAAEPDLFAGITLDSESRPQTWRSYIDRAPAPCLLQDIVHGALLHYDLDDLE